MLVPDEEYSARADTYSAAYSVHDVWEDIRYLLDGRSYEVCVKHLSRIFRNAMAEGTLNVDHWPLWDFILDQVASSLELKPEIRAADRESEELAALWRSWWASGSLAAADRLRCSAGYAVLHCRVVDTDGAKEIVDLEVLCGDQVDVTPDPYRPRDWGMAKAVTIRGESNVTYTRQPDGTYIGTRKAGQETEELGVWAACPVTAWYYRPSRVIMPPPYSILRDAHIMLSRHLTKANHDYLYRLNQAWAKGLIQGRKSVRIGSNIILDLGDEGSVGTLQTQDTYGPAIESLTSALKLLVLLYGLPPVTVDTVNRSETGAARSWDEKNLTGIERRRRAAIDRDVILTTTQWAPLLPGGSIEFRCAEPPPPVAADKAQEMAGVKSEMLLGITTPAVYLSKRDGIPVVEAQRRVDAALARNKDAFPELFGTPQEAQGGGQNQA